ncbi:thioredoxin domain-containing protein [Novosphingobium sp. KCTC 2891]|uniref:DsbA family protein n=1 Tax=Novosphingobium sp. KCTC 2891 TaxID=2989730 RepID=UPI0022212F4B|nr:thioredoxin domain-containing protein [Novosphingobium sp. KCTC 2891]MCW1382115.1 thioredoxin domain-containing protein [Novosphingobium sp. KCTC 2891]
MASSPPRVRPFLILAILLVVAGIGGGWWFESHREASAGAGTDDRALAATLSGAGIDARQRAAIEALVRSYILDHPEILPEAMDRLQARENQSRLAPMRGALETPFPGAVLGNPAGKITLVEFTDFACTYCRKSVEDVEALVRANPDLKVVVRELPIIAPESEPAARMGLAAAAQGKYAAFHKAMFAGPRPSAASIAAAAQAAGLDMAAAQAFGAKADVQKELERNLGMARQLGINGTPSWVIGEDLINGAVGPERLQQAIDAARKG